MNQKTKIMAMLLVLALCAAAQADELLVPAEYLTIQDAIDDCNDGDEVIVADGTYTGPGNRDIDFLGKTITVRSESGPENCIIDCDGTEIDPHRGFYFHNGEDANSILDGFTITDGNASGFPRRFDGGGGIWCLESGPTITNCTIIGNSARAGGGGISCWDSSPIITNCTISGNSTKEYDGGGISCYEGSLTITNCIISGNSTSTGYGGGGAISCYEGSLTITNCTINNNTSEWGGAIVFYLSTYTIANCTFTGNSARWAGAILCGDYGGSSLITNCIISGNSATWGGGIYCSYKCIPMIINCVITANMAESDGGGIFSYDSEPTIANCTFASNSAPNGSALACDSDEPHHPSNVQLTNSILWDGGNEVWNNDGSTITITYSDVQGSWPGEGNIDLDPCFVDPGYWADANDPNIIVEPNDPNAIWVEGDYHLLRTSPCVDAGTDANVYTDIEGNVRPFDFPGVDNNGELPEFDMGAYELVPVEAQMKLTPQALNCNSKGKYVKAHFVLPEGFSPEDVDVNAPAIAEPMGAYSEYIRVFSNNEGPVKLEIIFDREAFCETITETGEVEVTVIGSLTAGRYFYATDTIEMKP